MNSVGYISLVDRTKDLIKTDGEWISSVDLEIAIIAHPKVLQATVIGMPYKKWQEHPLACVVLKPDAAGKVKPEDILEFLKDKVVKWWVPDDVPLLKEILKKSLGKFNKKELSKRILPEIIKASGGSAQHA